MLLSTSVLVLPSDQSYDNIKWKVGSIVGPARVTNDTRTRLLKLVHLYRLRVCLLSSADSEIYSSFSQILHYNQLFFSRRCSNSPHSRPRPRLRSRTRLKSGYRTWRRCCTWKFCGWGFCSRLWFGLGVQHRTNVLNTNQKSDYLPFNNVHERWLQQVSK